MLTNDKKGKWIYIVATKTSLEQDGSFVTYANVGETTRTPRERLKEYKKSGGGAWELIASFEVHPEFSDKFIHKELKSLNYQGDPRKSRNTEEFLFNMKCVDLQKFIHHVILRAHELHKLKVPEELLTHVLKSIQSNIFLEVEEHAFVGSLFLHLLQKSDSPINIFCGGQSIERNLIISELDFNENYKVLFLSDKLKGELLKEELKKNLLKGKKVVIIIPSRETFEIESQALSKLPLSLFLFYSRFSWGYPLPLVDDPFVERVVGRVLPTQFVFTGLADLPFNVKNLKFDNYVRVEHLDFLKA